MKDERLVSKMEGETIFSEATETVWWLDLTDPDPRNFTTDLCHRPWAYLALFPR